jgi:hypothetical protein
MIDKKKTISQVAKELSTYIKHKAREKDVDTTTVWEELDDALTINS